MSNWEDTVMSDKALLQSMLGLPDASGITEYAAQQDMNQPPGSYYKAGASSQAEISFKAGINAIIRWGNEFCDCDIEREHPIHRHFCPKCWQSKMKEVGDEREDTGSIS